jgi:hypothetical protein
MRDAFGKCCLRTSAPPNRTFRVVSVFPVLTLPLLPSHIQQNQRFPAFDFRAVTPIFVRTFRVYSNRPLIPGKPCRVLKPLKSDRHASPCYCRVSSDSQKHDNQREEIKRWLNGGYAVTSASRSPATKTVRPSCTTVLQTLSILSPAANRHV